MLFHVLTSRGSERGRRFAHYISLALRTMQNPRWSTVSRSNQFCSAVAEFDQGADRLSDEVSPSRFQADMARYWDGSHTELDRKHTDKEKTIP